MKQRDWFWCGSVLFALAMFISLHCIQEPLNSGIAGGLCAFASTILLGYGLRADAREESVAESKRIEEKQKQHETQRQTQRECVDALLDYLREWFDAQQQSYADSVNQLQTDITAVATEILTLQKIVVNESQLQSKAFAQFSKDVGVCSEADQTQIKESAKTIYDLLLKQHTALCKILESQGKESTNYYKFMIDQPWTGITELSEVLQSIAAQVDSMLSAVEYIQSDTEKQVKIALDKLKEDSKSLQEKLQFLSETLETQGKESRDAMERIIQCYSDVTSQDIEVLTALARDSKV